MLDGGLVLLGGTREATIIQLFPFRIESGEMETQLESGEMQTQPNQPKAAQPRARLVPSLTAWLRDLVISLLISAFVIIFLYQPVKVEGTSMMPGLDDQERIFINKFVYRLEPIQRGDVIVFRYPRDLSKSYIKRVIGMPGDRVRIDEGQVFVNGVRLREVYVPDDFEDLRSYPEVTVPANSFYVLGDHRSMSNDSRDFGCVSQQFVSGKAVFVYWPMDKLGTVR